MICLVSYSNLSDVLSAFTCASDIGNCQELNILSLVQSKTLAMWGHPFPCVDFSENTPLLKALKS